MTPKRILLYGTNYYPEPIGIPRYTTEMAEDMASIGHHVTIIAACPLYPTWAKHPAYNYNRYSRETRNGVEIIRTPTYVPRNTGFSQRILYELLFWAASIPVLIREAYRGQDALVITSPPLALCSALILPLRNTRKVVIVKDLQIDIAENMGVVRNSWLLGALYRVERWLLNKANLVTAVSLGMLKRIQEKELQNPACEFFPDWVDTDRLSEAPHEASQAKRENLALPTDKVLVGYSGNLARKQGIEVLVEIADRFRSKGRDNVHFLICGEGPAQQGLSALVHEKGLKNVTLTPLQPEADLPDLLSAIDVHVVPQKDEVSDLVMPGKMFNIMSCSRTLVVTAPAGSAIDKVMILSGAGIRVSRQDIDSLDAAICKLCDDETLRKDMGKKGRDYVLNHMAKRSILDKFYSLVFGKQH